MRKQRVGRCRRRSRITWTAVCLAPVLVYAGSAGSVDATEELCVLDASMYAENMGTKWDKFSVTEKGIGWENRGKTVFISWDRVTSWQGPKVGFAGHGYYRDQQGRGVFKFRLTWPGGWVQFNTPNPSRLRKCTPEQWRTELH